MGLIIIIIGTSLFFDFLNGFHDSANSIATVVATRVLKPRTAVLMAAAANFIAAFLFTTAVAATIGKGIIAPFAISSQTILAGLIGASIWNIITWYLGLPTSSSHALVGGLIGSTIVASGTKALIWAGIQKTLIFIFIAPILGFIVALLLTAIITGIIHKRSPQSVNGIFSKLQIASSFLYSLGHGTNDAQKTIGVISLTLFSNHLLGKTFYIPIWVVICSYLVIAVGTYFGGWRIVKTMGTKIFPLKPFQGFCAETTSAILLFATSHFGIPVSTTHVIAGSIMGVGSAHSYKKVRWLTTRKIFLAWIFTIPGAMLLAVFMSEIMRLFF